MAEIGLFLSSEEHGPKELVAQAQQGEAAGFRSVLISDHFHPWIDEQGESPFVWGVIGAIASTTKLKVTTGVTCPILRIHPVIVAQAAATASLLLDGRFVLGVGTGEALNEHILGDRWPPIATRLQMLEEAVAVMRLLWQGTLSNHCGDHYTVENARIVFLSRVPTTRRRLRLRPGLPASWRPVSATDWSSPRPTRPCWTITGPKGAPVPPLPL